MVLLLLFLLFIKEQVVSHDKPGAADHSSVDSDVFFDPTQSSAEPSSGYYILLEYYFLI